MANLKTELDEYMQQKEARRSYFSLPRFSTPRFFSRDENPDDETVTWFQQAQKDYCTLVSCLLTYQKNFCIINESFSINNMKKSLISIIYFVSFLFQSRTQRFIGFGACLSLGLICFILSFFYIPLLLLQAKKFVLLFTMGSMFFIMR
jgi:hypothetical protein